MSRITRFILTLALISLVAFADMFAATPPSKQARFIGVLNKTSTTIQINFQKGNGLNRAVVVSPDATVETPVDEETYTDENGSYASAYDLGNGDKVVDILTGGSTGTNITGLTPGVTYTIQVFEFSTGGSPSPAYNTSTAPVNPRSETTLISVLPPDNLTITNGFPTATTVEFTWDNPTPTPDSYLVTLNDDLGDPVSFYDMLDISLIEELEITELDEGTEYDFYIRSYIGNSESVDATVNFTTLVDNTAPTLTSADMHLNGSQSDLLYSDNAGDDVTIVVEFNEPMKTWIFPTITLTGQPSGMTYESGYWNEPGTIFTAEYGFTDDDETVLAINIEVSGGEDLAGNAFVTASGSNPFNVDTEEGDLSAFNYETAGSFSAGSQSHCKSADNEDVIEFEITLAENGFMPANSLFEVIAEDQDNDNQIVFLSGNSGNGVYLFTSTLAIGHAEGEYNLIIKFTDGAGNVTEDLSNSFLFRIDNTPPSISNVNFANTCANDADEVTLTFTATDVDGCGTFNENDITVDNNPELSNDWVFSSKNGDVFTYTLNVPAGNDGVYDVTITATDDAGNESTDETTGAFTIDNTIPVVDNVSITPATCVNNTTEITLTFDVTDVITDNCGAVESTDITVGTTPGGGGTLTTNFGYQSVSTTGNVSSFTYSMIVDETNSIDDNYVVNITATDKAGNASLLNTDVNFDVDNTAPVISAASVSAACENGGNTVTLTFTATEAGCGTFNQSDIVITDDVDTENDWTYSTGTGSGVYTYTLLLDAGDPSGLVTVAINATDDATNAATEVTTTFTIDNVAPVFSAYTVTGLDGSCLKVGSTLEFTVDVVEDGCGTFDETDFTIGITPVPTNALVPDGGNPVSGTGTYKFTLLLDAGDTEGAYNLTFDGTDDAGNAATQYVPGGVEFTLDKTAPVFSAYTVTGLDGSCLVEGETIEFTVEVVEAGCGTFDSDDITILVTPALTNSLVADGGNPANGSGTYTFSAVIHADDVDGDYEITFNGTDVAGNTATEYAEAGVEFAIDNTPPQLSNLVTTSVPGGSPTRVGGTAPNRVLTIAFDELTDGCAALNAASFTYTITKGVTALTVGRDGGPTKVDDTWTTTFTIPSNEPDGDYEIVITAEDDNGNVFTLDPAGVEFVIDNTPPVVSIVRGVSVPVNPNRASDKIIRSDDGANNFYIEFVYNEDMDTSVDPTYSFPTVSERPNVAVPPSTFAAITNAVAAPGAAGWQGDNRSFRFYFDVDQDAEIDMEGINVKATGGQDVVGNVHTNVTEINVFDVDLITPGLSNVVATPSLVTNNFTNMQIDFTFDEEMDLSLVPTITFPLAPTVGGAISIVPGTSSWLTDFVYRATYAVTVSSGIELTNVQVKIENANDACGNPFDPTPVNNVFSVDTKEPACAGITLDPIENQVLADFLDFEVEVKMDQVLNNTVHPTVTFTNSNANYSTSVGTFSTTTNTNDTYTFIVTHDGTEEELTETISIIGFKDLNGNEQTVACEATFDVDTELPTITSLTVSDDKICMDDDAGTEVITITFSEEMDANTAPTIAFADDLIDDNILSFTSGSWNTPTNTIYTATYAVSVGAGEEYTDVDVQVSGARDVNSNLMDADNTTGADKIDVDTKAPEVTAIAFNPLPSNAFGVNRSNIGDDGFEVVVTYDEAMDGGSTPTIAFSAGAAALTIGTGGWTSTTVYTQAYTVNDVALEESGISATVTAATDACGNVQESYDSDDQQQQLATLFDIDLIAPTCVSIVADTDPIYEGDLVQGLTVTFSEEMSGAINPSFDFDVSTDFTTAGGNWDNQNPEIFTVNYTHGNVEEEIPIEIVSLNLVSTQPTDLAGNPIEVATCTDNFEIDTRKPLVSSVSFSPEKIIATTSSFFVTVEFDEDMKAVPNPTIQFNETLTGLFNYIGYTTPTSDSFVFEYGVTDVDLEVMDIDIDINVGQDVAGNVMATHTSTETFAIDQIEPTVVSLSVSDVMINKAEANDGLYNFEVSVTFSEAMNTSVDPTLAFSPNPLTAPSSLALGGGAWSNGDKTATWIYIANDQNTVFEDIDITVTGGEDVCGNATDYTTNTGVYADEFSIDTEEPTVAFGQASPLGESCVNGTEAIDFTASDGSGFSGIDEVQARIGAASFATFTSGSLLNTVAGWGAASEGAITLDLMATDNAGNTSTISRNYTKDATAPQISNIAFTNTCVTTGDEVTVTFDVVEDGCATFDSDDVTITGFANSFVADGGNPTGTGTYVFTLLIDGNDTEGAKTVAIYATDGLGNQSVTTTTNSAFTVDKTAPSYSINTAVAPTCANNTDVINLAINSADAGGCGDYDENNITASTSLGAAVVTPFGSGEYGISIDLSGTNSGNDGTYNIDIVMTDAAGNVRNETITNAFTVDNTAPAVTFQDPEGGETVNATKVLNFIATDGGCGIASTEVSVDNTNWTAATSGSTDLGDISEFAGLNDVGFTLYIRSTDVAGNIGTSSVALTKDATAPEVLSFTPSHSVISTQNDGEEFTITFDFNEDMDTSIDPTVGISLVQVLPQNSVSGNWTDSDTYVASFGNINASISITYIDAGVSISGAKDDTEDIGNEMFLDVDATLFDVDTEAPTITDASIKSSNSVNDQYARVGNDIILTIEPSEALTAITGTIAGYGITSTSDQYLLNGTYVITVSTDPGVPAGLVTFAVNYKDVNGNSGATLTSVTDGSSVTVDKVAPVGTIAQAGGQADPTVDSPINFALTFSEDVYGLTDGDIVVSGTAGATTAVVTTTNASTYNVAVTGMTGSGTVVITLANATVTDIAGNDNTATTNTDNSVQYNVSGATDVAAGAGVEPATLSSLVDTQGEAVLNFDFAVTDDGVVPGADGLATKITDISVSQGAGDDFLNDWTNVIAGAELSDGTNTVTGTVGASSIAFTGLDINTGKIGYIADNATKTYTLKVWLSNTPSGLIDNENLAFKVNRSSFTVDGGGSSFKSGAGTGVESGSTKNAIDVISTTLAFTTTPAYTAVNEVTEFVVEATDPNGNRDVDYGPYTLSLTSDKSNISSGGSGTIDLGIITLNTVVFDATAINDFVTASDNGPLSDVNSDQFNIKFEEPLPITTLGIGRNTTSFDITWSNPSGKNTLILAKKDVSSYTYTDELGMDNETGWIPDAEYNISATPDDASAFVIYAGVGTSVKMTGLIAGGTKYTVAAYAYSGTLNDALQNFNETVTSLSKTTKNKEVNYSDAINKGMRLGIDNITPQPASLNNVVSLQVETIEDMPLTLELYDSKGQKMMTLFEGRDFNAGETQFEFNLDNSISSGQHFLRLTGNGHVVIAPLVIVK